MCHHTYNERILQLWKDNLEEYDLNHIPWLFRPFPGEDTCLFVGLNPSYSPDQYARNLKRNNQDNPILNPNNEPYTPDYIRDVLNLDHISFPENNDNIVGYRDNDQSIGKVLDIQSKLENFYTSYYQRLRNISESLNLDFYPLDLFFYRQTDHLRLPEIVSNITSPPNRMSHLNEFGENQFNIAIEVINFIRPKVIVVINATARQLLLDRYDMILTDDFDHDSGHWWFPTSDFENIPLFFTNLTSRGGIDTGSYIMIKKQVDFSIGI